MSLVNDINGSPNGYTVFFTMALFNIINGLLHNLLALTLKISYLTNI